MRQNFRVSFLKKLPIFYVRQEIILTFSSGSAKIITVNIFRLKDRRRKQMIKYDKKSILKSGVRKIALLRVFAAAFLFVFLCAGAAGCARNTRPADSSVREGDTGAPISENPTASSNAADTPDGADTAGNPETPDSAEDNSSSDTNPGGDMPDASSVDEKNDDKSGETDHSGNTPSGGEEAFADDDAETSARYAEYYADGKLILRCAITTFGGMVHDEPLVPGKDGYSCEWREVASKDKNVIRYEAQYTVIVYTIEYYPQGGQPPEFFSAPLEYTVETPTFGLYIPRRRGYVFCGWYTEKEPYINKIERIERGSTGNITLYAKWEKTA